MATESDIQQAPFVKQLAANDRPTRDAAIQSLRTFLSGRRSLPPLELLKLWKGLFYCMWMSDRPLPQQSLAQALADLVHVFPDSSAKIAWLDAFWATMGREWTGIDVLRMEKFLLLVRRMVGAGLQVCEKAAWDEELVDQMLAVLGGMPFEAVDMRIPNGMRYHVIDIYVDELERVGVLGDKVEEVDESVDSELVEKLLGPLTKMAKDSPTKTVRKKAKEALADERLPWNRRTEEQKAAEAEAKRKAEEGEWNGFDD